MYEIDDALMSKKQKELPNTDRTHAKILAMKLLRRAEKEVIIFCHRLAQDVYGSEEVCEALDEAYQNNPDLNVQVYIRESAPEYSPFVDTLLVKGVRIHTNVHSKKGDILLVDGNGREEKSEKERKGQAYFNNQEWAESARKRIEALIPVGA